MAGTSSLLQAQWHHIVISIINNDKGLLENKHKTVQAGGCLRSEYCKKVGR